MQQLIQWIGSKGAWSCSRFSDLPELKHDQRSPAHHWCVVAGGLALILSRAGDARCSADFRATLELYEMLRDALRQGRRPRADAALVGDVMHEVAETADPMTQASLGMCFRECLKRSAAGEEGRSTGLPDLDDTPTVIRSDLLGERSHALRQAVAAARTHFAELK